MASSSISVSHKNQAAQSESSSHPFSNSKNLLVVIPDDKIDIEEESRFYDKFCQVRTNTMSVIHFPEGPERAIHS